MAHGIQHIQATQLLELSSSCIGGVSELRNEKWLHMWYRVGAVQEAGGVTKEELTVLRTKIDPLNIYGTRQR